MSYKASKNQALAHKAFMQDGYKRGVLLFGRQSGKTYFATNHAWISAVLKQGRYFIVFKTYKQAHEVVWRQYVPLIPKELIYKTNEADLLIELNYIENANITLPSGDTILVNHDKTKPRSTIQLLGSDQADSHRGFRADGMIFDEYADQDPDNFKVVYEPMFSTTNGWIIFMGTPRGYNHFYDLIQYAKEDDSWFYLESTWRDSPYVSEEFMARVRAEAEKRGMLSGFMQEYELEFRSVQGAVYPMFDRKIHLIKPADIPEDLTYYGAIDFGWHTTAFLLLGVDKDQTWYLIDEVYGKEETLENLIPRIKNVIGDKRVVLIVADSANRDAIEVMSKDFPVTGVNKANDTRGYALGISLVTEKLKPRTQLVGMPKPSLYIGTNCKNFIFEIESYRFPEEKPDRNPTDIPVKENDHGCFTADTLINGRRIEEFGDYMGEKKVWEWNIAGVKIKATPDHPILTQRGFVRADSLRYNDIIWKNKLFTTVTNGIGAKIAFRGLIGCTFSALVRQMQAIGRDSIVMSGGKRTAKYPLAIIFTTLMATPSIISLIISAFATLLNTWLSILKIYGHRAKRTFTTLLKGQLSGQKPKKGKPLGVKWVNKILNIYQGIKSKDNVITAPKPILQRQSLVVSATRTVKPVRYVGVVKTYNLVTRSGMYRVEGLAVSNCDAIRYLFLHLKHGMAKDDKLPKTYLEQQSNQYGLI